MPVRRVGIRAQDDLVDQSAQQVRRLGPAVVFVQRRGKIRDLAGVDVGEAGMDGDRFRGGQGLKLAGEVRPFRLEDIHLRLHRRMEHPCGNRRHDGVDLPQDLCQPTVGIAPRGEALETLLLALPLELRNERGDQIGMQQLVLQAGQDPGLDVVAPDRLAIVAGAHVARGGAAVAAVADHDVIRSTTAAFQRSGKQVARPAAQFGPGRRGAVVARGEDILPDRTLSDLHPLPLRIVDDPQMRDVFGDPGRGRIRPGLAFAGLGVLHEALPVPDEFAKIKPVVQDARAALPVARDRRERPGAGTLAVARAGRGDPFAVQRDRDGPRALAAVVVQKDTPDHGRLGLVDHPVSGGETAVGQRLAVHAVTIADAARRLARLHPTLEPAVRLLGQLPQEQRRHRAAQPDVHLADLALGFGEELHAEIGHPLVQAGDMFLIARQPIEAFRHQHIDPARHGHLLHALELGAQMRGPAHRFIREDFDHRPALVVAQPTAQPDLVRNRGRRLLVR